MSKAGELSYEANRAGVEESEHFGPQGSGPIKDSEWAQKANKRSSGGTWKELGLHGSVMGPMSTTDQPSLPLQKRNQTAMLEEEVLRSFKKTKAVGDSTSTNEVQISAEVAMQPRRTP
jgi:hypothetical protein